MVNWSTTCHFAVKILLLVLSQRSKLPFMSKTETTYSLKRRQHPNFYTVPHPEVSSTSIMNRLENLNSANECAVPQAGYELLIQYLGRKINVRAIPISRTPG